MSMLFGNNFLFHKKNNLLWTGLDYSMLLGHIIDGSFKSKKKRLGPLKRVMDAL